MTVHKRITKVSTSLSRSLKNGKAKSPKFVSDHSLNSQGQYQLMFKLTLSKYCFSN